jgi:hypothetical protein
MDFATISRLIEILQCELAEAHALHSTGQGPSLDMAHSFTSCNGAAGAHAAGLS